MPSFIHSYRKVYISNRRLVTLTEHTSDQYILWPSNSEKKINGELVSPTEGLLNALMLLYADDLVLLAPDSRSLEAALLVLDQVARK